MKNNTDTKDVLLPVWRVSAGGGTEVTASAETADAAIVAAAPQLGVVATRCRVAADTVRAVKAQLVIGGYDMESVAKSDVPDLMHESAFVRRTTSFVNPAAFKVEARAVSATVRPDADSMTSRPGVVGRPRYEIVLTVVVRGDPGKVENWLQATREKLATKTSVGR